MTMPANYQKHLDDFFLAIKPVVEGYRYPTFNFVAIRHEGKFAIIQAALLLNTSPPRDIERFESANVRAGQYRLSELNLDIYRFVDALYSGTITTPDGELLYLMPDQGPPSPYYMPFHDFGLENQHRLNVLRISSKSPLERVSTIELDWQLKASSTPFDSLQELAFIFRLGQLRHDQANVEIIAYNVAVVDFGSTVSGNKAWPTIRLAGALDPRKVLLGYRIQEGAGVTGRASICGDTLTWSAEGYVHRATAEVTIPPAATLHCIVSYDGIAQQFGWLADPDIAQNPRRATFEVFDRRLETVREIIENAQGKYRSRDLESALSWLLWMLGFGVAHLGDTKGMQEAADLIACTPIGHIAIVECTIGQLKTDKLSLLHDRVENVRKAVLASGNPKLHILPIVATSKARAELPATDIERAERLGIIVYSHEDIMQMVNRTRFVGDAEQIYSGARAAAALTLERHALETI